jgi:monothiol glutaredoxin
MTLTREFRLQIDDLVKNSRVVLFMKGTRQAPQCGFSAKVVGMLDELVRTYETVNVLEDPQMREGIKEYSQWPTIPQLYIEGQFVGGCDIVTEMHGSGELQRLLGAPSAKSAASAGAAPRVPEITVSGAAAKAFREASAQSVGDVLRLEISSAFEYDLSIGPRAKDDVEVVAGGVTLFLDPASASRANGVAIDYVQASGGEAFKITSPSQPHAVRPIRAPELKAWFEQGRAFELFDVRPDKERAIAKIDRARPLDPAGKSQLLALDKKTPLVFHCHHGMRSRNAAEDALRAGFHEVYNLEGGIDAWSLLVEPSVPRY